jgi:cytochrome c55X
MREAALALLLSGPAAADGLPEGRATELARLVLQDCGSCHGLTLAGGLGPDIRPAALAGQAPEAVAAVILDGRPGTAMPPWRPLLTEAEAAWIAGYLLEGAR